MGRRGLHSAQGMAKMWAFVAIALGTISFFQAYGEIPRNSTRATSRPVEACNLALLEEHALEEMPAASRKLIEDLTGLPRLDLSSRPSTLKSTSSGTILVTESQKQFRLRREVVIRHRRRYLPLIAEPLESGAQDEAYVVILNLETYSQLKALLADARRYCTEGARNAPLPGQAL